MKNYGSPKAQRIAFATSGDPEGRPGRSPSRWSELAVFYDPTPEKKGRPWIAVALGCSSRPGERTKESVVQVGTLDRALHLFDNGSQLGRMVSIEAREWASDMEKREETIAAIENAAVALRPQPAIDWADQDAVLRHLYGDELETRTPATLISRDFRATEGTVRAALRDGREIKVPLTAVAPFIDIARFRAAREAANG